jgi:hypothetical protein
MDAATADRMFVLGKAIRNVIDNGPRISCGELI